MRSSAVIRAMKLTRNDSLRRACAGRASGVDLYRRVCVGGGGSPHGSAYHVALGECGSARTQISPGPCRPGCALRGRWRYPDIGRSRCRPRSLSPYRQTRPWDRSRQSGGPPPRHCAAPRRGGRRSSFPVPSPPLVTRCVACWRGRGNISTRIFRSPAWLRRHAEAGGRSFAGSRRRRAYHPASGCSRPGCRRPAICSKRAGYRSSRWQQLSDSGPLTCCVTTSVLGSSPAQRATDPAVGREAGAPPSATSGMRPTRNTDHTSRFATFSALPTMNSRRGSTTSPISVLNTCAASSMSPTFTCSSVRTAGSSVVFHN